MLKKTIKLEDFNGIEQSIDCYFHLTESELMDLQMSKQEGLDKTLQNIIDTKDNVQIYNYFRDIVQMSYGVKSADGFSFIKDEESTKRFVQSNAYSELLIELCSDADKAADFINGILPKKKTNVSSIPAPAQK